MVVNTTICLMVENSAMLSKIPNVRVVQQWRMKHFVDKSVTPMYLDLVYIFWENNHISTDLILVNDEHMDNISVDLLQHGSTAVEIETKNTVQMTKKR